MNTSGNKIFQLVKTAFLPIFSAMLVSSLAQQFLDKKIEGIIQSPQGLSSMIWLWGFLSLLAAMLFPLFVSLLCSYFYAFNHTKFLKVFAQNHLEKSLIESLRAWGLSFLWGFLFIIPGIVKYSYYMFSPYVVYFSTRYQNGEKDALDLSKEVFLAHWIPYSVYILLFGFVFPMILSSALDQYRIFNLHPISALACVGI
jgi:hypothetical protein